ncbi:hypothetical protein MJ1HA_1292 [Metallosphaera sedula]|nr:hypothetical protein MJ1HA_1292 [Metallosphaera sedula]
MRFLFTALMIILNLTSILSSSSDALVGVHDKVSPGVGRRIV